ncbi:hypothetical protein F5J12DRAFT_852176 [Pisolithus orientalis]|uniref:uncharacterized protein n=1 Tax=Pisolithus orientalis TaxID=936130 RepID=UPI002225762A|nr:uncharacterized protein F5J12DRAFT_852176 [Pisolithus orientalis]KAI5997293.1 hypothetical protein F5J12DRAFT_852176 [Pisolithus orientalis]
MNIAGPSQPRNRGSTASNRPQSTYEDDLLRILAQLGPDGTNQFREFYDRRNHQGQQMTDHEIAMRMFLQGARDLEAIEGDRALALALAQDLQLEDEPVVEASIPRRPNPPQPQNTPTRPMNPTRPGNNATNGKQTWGDWIASVFNGLFGAPQTSASAAAPATPVIRIQQDPPATTPARPTGHVCVICQDPIYGSEIRAPCGHYYDIPCVTDLIQSATRDESLYPPRCCRQNIPFPEVQPHLSHDLVTQFQEKSREFGIPNRVYCARQTCSRFLGPLTETIFGVTVYDCSAPGCGTRTCASCRGRYDGWMHTCRQDQGAEQVLNLGRTEGWARCPGCSQLIELNMGCYHMTCRCRTEFCYLCRARWKTCRCPQWDERRLFAAAEQRVDAQLGGGEHHHRLRDVQRVGDPVQPVQPRPQNVQVVQPRAQPAYVVQPRAPYVAPAFRAPVTTPVRPAAPLRVPGLPREVLPTPPVQPRVPTADVQTADTTVRHIQTRAQRLAASQSPATPTRPHSDVRSLVEVIQRVPSTQRSTPTSGTSTNAHPRVRPTVPPKPASLTSAITSPLPSPAVPPRPAGLTSIRSAGTGPTPARNVGTQNDTIRQRMIHEMAERLRVDHDCQHTKWKFRQGGGSCEHCHRALPLYLFRCVGCEMLVCNQCRRNRL